MSHISPRCMEVQSTGARVAFGPGPHDCRCDRFRDDLFRERRAADLRRGVEPLRSVIALLPQLWAVMLYGSNAKRVWKYFAQAHPDEAKRVTAVNSPYTGK